MGSNDNVKVYLEEIIWFEFLKDILYGITLYEV